MGVKAPQLPLQLANQQVEAYFATASALGGKPAIEIQFEAANAIPDIGAEPVTAFDLHSALLSLAGNPLPGQAVDRIGVLFAHSYAPRTTLFGLMFDRGFTTEDDPNAASIFTGVPRQGCAVFLKAIAAVRAADVDFQTEVAFTTAHELGHVFNLGHIEVPRCFMSQSQMAVAPPSTFDFIPSHEERLRLGITSANVWPGGSNYMNLGLLPPEPEEVFNEPRRFGLELDVDMDQREFHAWEPVEIDIRISVVPGLDRSFEIPDVLDPGYDAFDLWIDRPNGERVKYRACNFYCSNPRRIRLGLREPFERDVSLFGQSGGYTFCDAGIHRVCAELRLPGHGLLRSNVVEVHVLPQPFRGRRKILGRLLSRSAAARILFYRDGELAKGGTELLGEVCSRFAGEPSAAASHYALGRLFLRHTQRARRDEVESLSSAARDHLERAAGSDQLSRHRRELAGQFIGEISRPRRSSPSPRNGRKPKPKLHRL
jgi:hypothetical protein